MKKGLATASAFLCLLLAGGCATKKYVKQTTDPIQNQVEELNKKTGKQGELLDKTIQDVEKNKTEIGLTKEAAAAADSKAVDAQTKAADAGQKAQQNARDVEVLRNAIANIDDYKVSSEAVVLFGFNQDTLSKDAQAKLDEIAGKQAAAKRFFFAVEGFTDSTGPADYNVALSRRRADRVVNYLVAKHAVPVYRIYQVGLGKERPADEGKNKAAHAKNRRVEVRLYTADTAVSAASSK